MKSIKVNYVAMNKNPNGIEYDRNIEYFPLEIGTPSRRRLLLS